MDRLHLVSTVCVCTRVFDVYCNIVDDCIHLSTHCVHVFTILAIPQTSTVFEVFLVDESSCMVGKLRVCFPKVLELMFNFLLSV